MKVDYVLVLAAGKGTRMGDIGKELPKVLWPVYDKSLLELQVYYARELVPTAKIFINIFNYKDKIKSFVENNSTFKDVNIIEEQSMLDVGGAVHNIASSLGYKGNLLILNSDQFFYLNVESFQAELSKVIDTSHLMFSYSVNSSDGYNAIIVDEGKFKGIKLNKKIDRNKDIETYTGMSVINLSKLDKIKGPSKFFESVITQRSNCNVTKLVGVNYWDFGTISRYVESIKQVFRKYKSEDFFIKFLKNCGAISPLNFFENGYKSELNFNFSGKRVDGLKNSIILSSSNQISIDKKNVIVFNEITEDIL